ncbi:MAG: hypothetical protein ND895_07765 [Pyrinomonadaceae bacterium]|nr:hypothetical protein [Pyrinomonadaceae bacterium]
MLAENNKGPIRRGARLRGTTRQGPKPTGVSRWSRWARSIALRHKRFTQRRDSLALIVLRLRRPLNIFRERWAFTTRIVQPRLQLAINAFVKLVHWSHQQYFSGGPTRISSLALTDQRVFSSPGVLRTRSAPRNHGRGETSNRQIAFALASADRGSTAGFVEPPNVLKPPLTFVFERLKASKKSTHPSRFEVLSHQQARSIVERVSQQSRRTETMTIGTNTVIERQMSSQTAATQPRRLLRSVQAPTRVIEKAAAAPVTTVVETASWLQDKVPVTGLNIDQITDHVVRQLDRRVVAARERMGRV